MFQFSIKETEKKLSNVEIALWSILIVRNCIFYQNIDKKR